MQLISTIIAEDDARNAEILTRFVERTDGFVVEGIAQSLVLAKDMTELIKPDLILLDNYFPDGSGTELLQFIRTQNIQTDIIMITASKEVSTIRESLQGGIFDYIIKPISYQRLKDSLDKYLDYSTKLRTTGKMLQHDVDKLLRRNQNLHPQADTRLPKGIDSLTIKKIRTELINKADQFSAEDMSHLIGTSKTTARRYLEYLVSLNEVTADVNYGSVGRPERLYKRV